LAAADPRVGAAVAGAREDAERVIVADYLLAPGYFHDLATKLAVGAPVARPLLDDDQPPTALVDIVIDRYRSAC
ncbi:MAG: cobalamin biosynthesis protein CbiX, partial [Microbacterium sp.]